MSKITKKCDYCNCSKHYAKYEGKITCPKLLKNIKIRKENENLQKLWNEYHKKNIKMPNKDFKSTIHECGDEPDYTLTDLFNERFSLFLDYFENYEKIYEIFIKHKLNYIGGERRLCYCKHCQFCRKIIYKLDISNKRVNLPAKNEIPKL